jgi:riboflavin kinase/FMN adenylyltransferase
MKTLVGLDGLEPPEGGSVITIGTFDGVHLGHRGLIARTIETAGATEATSTALTWDRHPAVTLRPDRVPRLLSSPERKAELLKATGIELLAVLPFDDALSHLAAEDFVSDVLVGGLGARAILVGHNWRFGHKARGDVALLQKLGDELGFEVHGIDLQEAAGGPVSSSRVRHAVAEGDLVLARTLLARPWDIDGVVVRGAARGKELGYPTANLKVDPALALPPRGVYAGLARLGAGETRTAAVNIGVNPTFGGDPATTPLQIEAYLLDLDRDLYGATIRLELWERLRDEQKFDSPEGLIAQMGEDVAATRALVEP